MVLTQIFIEYLTIEQKNFKKVKKKKKRKRKKKAHNTVIYYLISLTQSCLIMSS